MSIMTLKVFVVPWFWQVSGSLHLPVTRPKPRSTRSPSSHRARVQRSFFNADGVVQESQRARLFTAVVFENLEQDIARGNGEYLTSLGVLLKIPEGEQDEFRARSQSVYPLLFASDRRTAESMLATLTSKKADH
jgi:hypothetical protein